MPRRRIEKTRADKLLDELPEDSQGPEAILGKDWTTQIIEWASSRASLASGAKPLSTLRAASH